MPDVLDQSEIDALLAEAGDFAAEGAIGGNGGGGGGATASSFAPPRTAAKSTLSPAIERELGQILQLQVPVTVRLAERTMPLSEVVLLTTGSIIEFEKSADADLDLVLSNKCIGRGQAVKVGENFGLRVTDISPVEDKINALGGV